MRTTFVLSVLAVVAPVLGAPTVVPIIKRAGPVIPDSYIIKFKDGSPKDTCLDKLTKGLTQPGSSVIYNYGPIFNGVAVKLASADLTFVRHLFDIEYIEQDSIVSLSYEQGLDELSSISERSEVSSSPPLEKRGGYGAGVDIYGIDTGIYIGHKCFGGRARWGATFGDYADADGNGHGTHTAGTVAGEGYGLAILANLVSVKVLSDNGSGSMSDVISGVNYACEESRKSGKPSIATMSLGGGDSPSLKEAMKNCIKKYGVHFTVAAGNSNTKADDTSPANVEEANTIGAVDTSKNNQRASFSNYGKFIDVWAPGVEILSAWIDGPDSNRALSGTSMATPNVAGILAVALSKYGQMSPKVLSDQLKSHAKNSVTFTLFDPARFSSNNLFAQPW